MWLKGCPRCQGDLFEEEGIGPELYGSRFVSCLQCGYTLNAEEEAALAQPQRQTPSSTAWRTHTGAPAGGHNADEAWLALSEAARGASNGRSQAS
jgi:hypothetical protein